MFKKLYNFVLCETGASVKIDKLKSSENLRKYAKRSDRHIDVEDLVRLEAKSGRKP